MKFSIIYQKGGLRWGEREGGREREEEEEREGQNGDDVEIFMFPLVMDSFNFRRNPKMSSFIVELKGK